MTPAEFSKKELPTLLLLLIPFVALPFLWDRLPNEVPIHWNASGEPDNFAGKTFGLLLLPCISIGVYGLFWLIPLIDPKRRVRFQQKPLPQLRFFLILACTFLFFATVAGMMDAEGIYSTNRLIPLGVLLIFLILGNYLSALQPNYFIGIRTPWTLENPEIWRKTHRLGGRLWVISSTILLVFWVLLPPPVFRTVFIAVGMGVMALVPVMYSFVLFVRQKDIPNEANNQI